MIRTQRHRRSPTPLIQRSAIVCSMSMILILPAPQTRCVCSLDAGAVSRLDNDIVLAMMHFGGSGTKRHDDSRRMQSGGEIHERRGSFARILLLLLEATRLSPRRLRSPLPTTIQRASFVFRARGGAAAQLNTSVYSNHHRCQHENFGRSTGC
ncbi:hypothetical protein PLICRDRAFT_224986 [Plicaturopsis crispa FD-325 SS-3]|nr:hypothetical protein PLICRDRAFT_224986 [Plicaturopsis crispa FD-325 SS-3]